MITITFELREIKDGFGEGVAMVRGREVTQAEHARLMVILEVLESQSDDYIKCATEADLEKARENYREGHAE